VHGFPFGFNLLEYGIEELGGNQVIDGSQLT